ncbi:MAG: DUF4864 domain-containing protein [Alphaproteobacteria bacterium]|nr:DUF4864 domain-containing protein [Alphaproteobacteria bacterium]
MISRPFFQFLVFLCILLPPLAWSAPSHSGEPASTVDAHQIRGVIEKQLDALGRDNWVEAFSYAAPLIQRKFGSPDTFRRMIIGGYAIVHRPTKVSFEALEEIGGRLAQKVFMVGPDGKSAMVVYFMERQSDGNWRISGVSIIPLADQSA